MFVVICDSATVSSVRRTPPFVLPCNFNGNKTILQPVGVGTFSSSSFFFQPAHHPKHVLVRLILV